MLNGQKRQLLRLSAPKADRSGRDQGALLVRCAEMRRSLGLSKANALQVFPYQGRTMTLDTQLVRDTCSSLDSFSVIRYT